MNNVKNKYFINPWYDYSFIILPPLYCILTIVFYNQFNFEHVFFWFIIQGFAATTTLYRAYLNPKVLKRFWFRLLICPFLIWGLMIYSFEWLLFFIFFEVVFDIWHSSLQTWGICRIYDVKMGNNPKTARNLDKAMNLFLYAGPLIAGVNFIEILSYMANFEGTSFEFLTSWFDFVQNYRKEISLSILTSFLLFLPYYFYKINIYKKQGYKPSDLKNKLLIFTALLCGICAFIDNYAIVYLALNFAHAIQTFGISYFSEKETLKENLNLKDYRYSNLITIGFFILGIVFIGSLDGLLDLGGDEFFKLVNDPVNNGENYVDKINIMLGYPLFLTLMQWRTIVSIMHYWSDSFIWSLQGKTLRFQKEKKDD